MPYNLCSRFNCCRNRKKKHNTIQLNTLITRHSIPSIFNNVIIVDFKDAKTAVACTIMNDNLSHTYKFDVHLKNIRIPNINSTCEKEKLFAEESLKQVKREVCGKRAKLSDIMINSNDDIEATIHVERVDIREWLIYNDFVVPNIDHRKQHWEPGGVKWPRLKTPPA